MRGLYSDEGIGVGYECLGYMIGSHKKEEETCL